MKENRNRPFIFMISFLLAVVAFLVVETHNKEKQVNEVNQEYEQATTDYREQLKEMEETNAIVIEQIESEKEKSVEKLNVKITELNLIIQKTKEENNQKINVYQQKIKELEEKIKEKQKKVSVNKAEPSTSSNSLGIFEVSAYTNRPEEGTDGITFSGKPTVEGITIACDRSILPIGSRVYIEGIGQRTCQDIGGGIKGKEIDLYVESLDYALNFGKKNLEVIILN